VRARLTDRMSAALAVLAALVVPYLALLLWVAIGVVAPARGRPGVGPSRWPSVDLVVPAHDEERALPATLASLHALAYPGVLRIIIVDDRSTDGTGAAAAAAVRRDPRMQVVRVERGRVAGHRR
jgi:cellulose synthase/poly-beta-1,6-N-acetylglucosamine synthase-like glycosyltransferase